MSKQDAKMRVGDSESTAANDQQDGERRKHLDSQKRDRRVIPRFSHANMRLHAGHIVTISRTWIALSALYAIGLVVARLGGDLRAMMQAFFYVFIISIVSYHLWQVAQAFHSYLDNESQDRLIATIERLRGFFLTALITTVILGIVHLITLF